MSIRGPFIIAVDFNARTVEWSMQTTDSRGRRIHDVGLGLQLIVANRIGATTFKRPVCAVTTSDITLVSEHLFPKLQS